MQALSPSSPASTTEQVSGFNEIMDCTAAAIVRAGQLLDVVAGRDSAGPCAWFAARSEQWRARIEWATLDLSGPYRAVFDTMLPDATQVADPFHLVKLANTKLDEVRRRVQNDTLGHRSHNTDPLYRCRRLLTRADERLDDKGRTKLLGLLEAGDPNGEVRMAWHAKEVIRSIYDHTDPVLAEQFVDRLGYDLQDASCPPEVNQMGRTIGRWKAQIVAWHRAHATNASTEAMNNLIKRVKRVAFGFKRLPCTSPWRLAGEAMATIQGGYLLSTMRRDAEPMRRAVDVILARFASFTT